MRRRWKDKDTRNNLLWTIVNGDPKTKCVSHTGYLAHGNSKDEVRGRNRHEYNSKSTVRNMEERKVDTKGKSPKQGLAIVEDLTIELPYHRLN